MPIYKYKNVGRVLFGFTVRKNIKQAIIIGVFAGIIISASAVGFADAYPTDAARKLVAVTFSSNSGLIAMLGKPHLIDSVAGFTAWRSLGAITLITSIWAIFLSTRLFRGDEEQGRLELIVTGKSSLASATKQLFAAAILMLVSTFIIISVFVSVTNKTSDFGWSLSSIMIMSFVVTLTAFLFYSIGALCSQLAATRAAALKIASAVFGIAFMLRALGDISDFSNWLSAISPLGWLERLHPLSDTNIVWLIPIFVAIAICIALSIAIANYRDYGESLIADKDSAKPKYMLLSSGGGLLARLHKTNALLWLSGLFIANFMFGTFLKSATQALNESGNMQKTISNVTNGSNTNTTELFAGVIFLLMMLLLMIMVIGQVSSFREEEARGYMDNLLVRQSSRLGLSIAKIGLILSSVIFASFLIALGMFLGAKTQGVSLDIWAMISASLNLMAAPILFLGAGFLLFGFVPRFVSLVLYSLIGWAFVVEIVGSVVNLNHWILDTSILHHLSIAPAVDVRWNIFWIYVALGIIMAIIGTARFTKRDIELM